MSLMFATRSPTPSETRRLCALLSTFRDGSGNQKDGANGTRAGWREIERCVAELVLGPASESKHIFDVIAPDDESPNVFYGLSIKSKELSTIKFLELSSTSRVYMELSNSPAKLWKEIKSMHTYTELHFKEKKHAEIIGNAVLATIRSWHLQGKDSFENKKVKGKGKGVEKYNKTLDLNNSRYLCLSYTKGKNPCNDLYQFHSFSLEYPKNIEWSYFSDKCLKGYDPLYPNEVLFEWYASSGGQLKYYPRAETALYKTEVFKMLSPPVKSLTEKAKTYFPDEF